MRNNKLVVLHYGHWCIDILIGINEDFEKDSIILSNKSKIKVGGSVNFAIASRQLGNSVSSKLMVSNDLYSHYCVTALKEVGIDVSEVLINNCGMSPVSIILESLTGWRTAIVISGINEDVTNLVININNHNYCSEFDVVHHGYPFLTPLLGWNDLVYRINLFSNALHFVDLNGAYRLNFELDVKYTLSPVLLIVKGNEKEWCKMFDVTNALQACTIMVEKGILCAVVTYGHKGAVLIGQSSKVWKNLLGLKEVLPETNNEFIKINATPKEKLAGQTTGAGDAFLAGLAHYLIHCRSNDVLNLEDVLQKANDVAANWILNYGALDGFNNESK